MRDFVYPLISFAMILLQVPAAIKGRWYGYVGLGLCSAFFVVSLMLLHNSPSEKKK